MKNHLPPRRWETAAARQSVANKLGLPYHDDMQDWPWEVASPEKLEDYLQLYTVSSEEERVVFMEMMLQATTEQPTREALEQVWAKVAELLNRNADIHAWSVHYWCFWEHEQPEFEIAFYLRHWWIAHFPKES